MKVSHRKDFHTRNILMKCVDTRLTRKERLLLMVDSLFSPLGNSLVHPFVNCIFPWQGSSLGLLGVVALAVANLVWLLRI
jgi:hypothetical protein